MGLKRKRGPILSIPDVKSQKDKERRYREQDLPFGVYTLQAKTKWWNEIELQNVVRQLDLVDGGRLLDLGSSDGRLLEYVHKRFPRCRLYGIDFAMNPLKVLTEKPFPSFPVCGDVCELPYKSESFDGAVSIQVIQHLASREERIRCLKDICRSLKAKGHLVITVINQKKWSDLVKNGKEGLLGNNENLYVYLYDPEDLSQDLSEAGFKNVKIVGINNLHRNYLKRIKGSGVWLDLFLTRYLRSVSLQKGSYLLARCTKQ